MRRMTGLTLLMLSVHATAFCAQAQDGPPSVALMPHWSKGDKIEYTMIKGRRKTQGAGVVSGQGTTRIHIEVLDANDTGYLIGWTAGETSIQDPVQAADPFTKAMVDLAKDVTIVFQLDSSTRLLGIRNWRELQALAHKVIEASLVESKRTGMDPATAERAREQGLSMFATRQQVEVLFAKSCYVLFMPLGLEYLVGRPLEYEDKLPNPFGGEPFPTRASFTLHPSSGWPTRVSCTRTTTIADMSQEDSLTFIEVEP